MKLLDQWEREQEHRDQAAISRQFWKQLAAACSQLNLVGQVFDVPWIHGVGSMMKSCSTGFSTVHEAIQSACPEIRNSAKEAPARCLAQQDLRVKSARSAQNSALPKSTRSRTAYPVSLGVLDSRVVWSL